MTATTPSGGTSTTTYTYNALGQRVRAASSSFTYDYAFDAPGQEIGSGASSPERPEKRVEAVRRGEIQVVLVWENVGDLLPPDLGMVVSPDDEEEVRAADKKGISWKEFDEDLEIHVLSKDEFIARGEGWDATVSLHAPGDFDGSGIEELLLRRDGALLEGTYRNHTLFILTRTSHHGPLRVVRKIEVR